ncbi:3-hydroxyacyl-ACP dehydratase FabZ family protein [Streptomyces gobiensis]|uniref:3-hydroxyacyl-ACP dehydratase FabZ family protein n=1 Tax=Streptomyces gobiensis TaxID=2875706 RepID=UPI001E2C07AF|nr:hypothetical protein [Streptomyces gobiensis]UGY94208.1 hypothetical protein test1122_22420 [Streptomyces gobiensis]
MGGEHAARSLAGEVTMVRAGTPDEAPPHAEATIGISADEPVFDGHYPGFPILPGVCLIECVHRAALGAFPAFLDEKARPRLAAVESARFLDPVYPGELVAMELSWKAVRDDWQCRAVVRNPRGDSARVRLRYTVADA